MANRNQMPNSPDSIQAGDPSYYPSYDGIQADNPFTYPSYSTRARDGPSNRPDTYFTTTSAPNLNEVLGPLRSNVDYESMPSFPLDPLASGYDGSSASLLAYFSGLCDIEGPSGPILAHNILSGPSLSDFVTEDTLGLPVPVLPPSSPHWLAPLSPIPAAYDGQQTYIHSSDRALLNPSGAPSSEVTVNHSISTPSTDVRAVRCGVDDYFHKLSL